MPGEFQDFAEDLFEPLGGVVFRRMFGGLGIFRQGMMFALIIDDVLYTKADATRIPFHEAEGCGPFAYEAKGRIVTTSYWRVPERLYDDPDAFRDWALAAFAVAERAQALKSKKKKPANRKPKA